ncbi:glycoside hydrolase family 13 protein [Diplocloster modestus]|uniref:Glycoside hydrolase family 13 protein n=1 Tax=Diplocloster modestus TaxID=2850322 RepID=A0ABS6KEX5_9FIRM|nr:glycoside hydrolase family 13 protein [Diplocloster modestus]
MREVLNKAAVLHRPTKEYIYPESRHTLVCQMSAARGDLERVELQYWYRTEEEEEARHCLQMTCSLRDGCRDYYRAKVTFSGPAAYVRYCFRLEKGADVYWYGPNGFLDHKPGMKEHYFEFLWPNEGDGYRAPDWSSSQVYYQIFPERFRNGDKSLDPPGTVPWGSVPNREEYMGGDLAGVIEKLEYIKDLGATCIYFTPIFHAMSNHMYDTVDYYSVDPRFGSADLFRQLVDEAHNRGLRIILDGVFNHCGYDFPFFQDFVVHGEQSAYREWFYADSYPVRTDPPNYDCVGHYKWMPKINLNCPEARRYFIEVGKYWIREFDTDGWRLDVADEVATSFWEQFAWELRQVKSDILLIGETWGDAGRILNGNRLDSAMNYLFKDAVTDFIARERITVSEFDGRLNWMLALYPEEVCLRMYNLLDSHDTARFLYECGGQVRLLKLAAAVMMTFPGCPAIFYGDEVGVTGANDPLCRQAMIWEEERQDAELRLWYKKLAAVRHSSGSLQRGSFCANLISDEKKLYGYLRQTEDEVTAVVINASPDTAEMEVPLPYEGEWTGLLDGGKIITEEILTGKNGDSSRYTNCDMTEYRGLIKVELEAYSIKIFQKRGVIV